MANSDRLEKAYVCMGVDPSNDESAFIYEKRGFRESMGEYLREESGIDWPSYGLTLDTVLSDVEELMKGVYHEENWKEAFKNEFASYRAEVLSEPKRTHSVGFPLNIKNKTNVPRPPETLQVNGYKIRRISYDEWKESYLNQIHEKSGEDVFENLDSIQNRPQSKTYWECEFKSRDIKYSASVVNEMAAQLVGQLLYATKFGCQKSQRDSKKRPRPSWTKLRPPQVTIANKSRDSYMYIRDHDSRQPESISLNKPKKASRLKSIPDLDSEDEDGYDLKLQNAFQAYQSGMTNYSKHGAFLDFWRGIEILGKRETEDTEKVPQRAKFALELIGGTVTDRLKYGIEDIYEKRCKVVHQGSNVLLHPAYVESCKIFLDSLISLYLGCRNNFKLDEMRDLLRYGPDNHGLKVKKENLLDKALENEFEHWLDD